MKRTTIFKVTVKAAASGNDHYVAVFTFPPTIEHLRDALRQDVLKLCTVALEAKRDGDDITEELKTDEAHQLDRYTDLLKLVTELHDRGIPQRVVVCGTSVGTVNVEQLEGFTLEQR